MSSDIAQEEDRICLEGNRTFNFFRQYNLLDLFPKKINEIKEIIHFNKLNEFLVVLNISLEAVEALLKGDLNKFDSFVGENACEIRAIWIAIIASKKLEDHIKTYKNILKVKNIIDIILYYSENNPAYSTDELKEFLIRKSLEIQINFEVYFIIQTFLLTEIKIIPSKNDFFPSLCIPAKSDSKRLKRFGDVSSNFLEKLIRKSRKVVAAACVQFVQKQADNSNDEKLIDMVSDKFIINHNNHLLCTPMFWTYKCCLFSAIKNKIPVIIRARFLLKESGGYRIFGEDCLFFETSNTPYERELVYRNVKYDDLSRAAFVIQGVVQAPQDKCFNKERWRENILRYSINTIVLAGAADHPQYPDVKLDDLICQTQDSEYLNYKRLAKEVGFSLDNPTTFFIQHVYCSRADRLFPS